MSDQFLHRIRKEPPPTFMRELRQRLKRDERTRRSAAFSILRAVLMFALGGAALAATLLWVPEVRTTASRFWNVTLARETRVAPQASPENARGTPEPEAYADAGMDVRSVALAHERFPNSQPISESENRFTGAAPGDAPAIVVGATASAASVTAPSRRDSARIVAAPIVQNLAQRFAALLDTPGVPAPKIETAAATDAFRAFCERDGEHADIVFATRRITIEEFEACRSKRVDPILEARIGYVAVVLTGARMATFSAPLSTRDILLALARRVPDPSEPTRLADNRSLLWSEVNPTLEVRRIAVLGPPRNSAAFQAFVEVLLEAGCDADPRIRTLRSTDRTLYDSICHSVREDGVYIEAAETSTLVTQSLWADPNAIAVLSYEFYDANRNDLTGSLLQGAEPSMEAITSGSYPASRHLYMYVDQIRAYGTPALGPMVRQHLEGRGVSMLQGLVREAGFLPAVQHDGASQFMTLTREALNQAMEDSR